MPVGIRPGPKVLGVGQLVPVGVGLVEVRSIGVAMPVSVRPVEVRGDGVAVPVGIGPWSRCSASAWRRCCQRRARSSRGIGQLVPVSIGGPAEAGRHPPWLEVLGVGR